MSSLYDVIKRPIITEKGLTLKEQDRTLCFEVADNASKTQIQEAVDVQERLKRPILPVLHGTSSRSGGGGTIAI